MVSPTLDVEVALPLTFNPLTVVVPKPLPLTVRNFVESDDEATSNIGLV
jgi:hypothetical protein